MHMYCPSPLVVMLLCSTQKLSCVAIVSVLDLDIEQSASQIAGLMLGPVLLGWIADVSSVRVALQANAALLVLTMAYFGVVAAEAKQS